MSEPRQNSWLTASTDSASFELTVLQTVISVARDSYGSEQKSSWSGGRCSRARWASAGSLAESPVGSARPSRFAARLKCLGDDREIVAVCQRTTFTCQESAGSGRRLLEKETSIVSGDGWIRHSRLSVNIHDVIFSLKARLCLRAGAIAAAVVSV